MTQKEVNRAWLVSIAIQIRKGEVTMSEAAKKVEFDTIAGIKEIKEVHRNTLHRYFKNNGIKVFEVGRKGFRHSVDNIVDEVKYINKDLQVGITKTWMILNKKGTSCSRYEVERIFHESILPPKPHPPKPKIRCRYLVDKVNGAWHGDIHYIVRDRVQKFMFALIDDRSRFIIGYGIFDHKYAINCVHVFEEAIVYAGRTPLVFWSDNGKENIGKETKEFLNQNNIHQVLTIPGNPQSNGKIEKFWPGMEKRISKLSNWPSIYKAIEKYVNDYNFSIPHMGLEKDSKGFNKCPVEVFSDETLQADDIDSTNISIDDKGHISLAEFIHKHNGNPKQNHPYQFDISDPLTLLNHH